MFDKFCDYLNGKLKWSETKAKDWTETVFQFFSAENAKQIPYPYVELKEHMNIDYIWRYDATRYTINDIDLAVEHEGIEKKVEVLVSEEIQHLIDLRARNKIAIFYPSSGDESPLLEQIQKRIKSVSERYRLEENYLIMLGYATTKEGKRATLWKACFLDKTGNITQRKERVIVQKQ
jgi:hypothetical protein